jgi:signal transduction histidine kinase
MDSVHRFARELRPAMLDELGLLPALRSCLRGFAERTGLEVDFQASADAEELDEERKTVLFRVIQESLTNAAKHAQATGVTATCAGFSMGCGCKSSDLMPSRGALFPPWLCRRQAMESD